MLRFFFFVGLLTIVSACQTPDPPVDNPIFNFDQFIGNQVKQLVSTTAKAIRSASIGTESDQITFTPDSSQWTNDLDIFRELDIINKPIYQAQYEIQNRILDQGSNLLIDVYSSQENLPVEEIRFYYFGDFDDIRKIEASYKSGNSIYQSSRYLTLHLDNIQGQSRIAGYTIKGIQKMMLMDSVEFDIETQIEY